jgi:SAM-dependent methyltransferase
VLLVSTLEHVGADNTVYGLDTASDGDARVRALRELRRVLAPDGSLLVTVPLGERGDHGWFRQEDERGWSRLYARSGLFLEEVEAYELLPEGWRATRSFRPEGVRYGERGPAASAVLCADLRPGRLRRLFTPGGLRTAARRRAGGVYRRRVDRR